MPRLEHLHDGRLPICQVSMTSLRSPHATKPSLQYLLSYALDPIEGYFNLHGEHADRIDGLRRGWRRWRHNASSTAAAGHLARVDRALDDLR